MKALRDALASANVLFISASKDDFDRNRLFNFIPRPDDGELRSLALSSVSGLELYSALCFIYVGYGSSYFGPLSAEEVFVESSSSLGSGDFLSCLISGDFSSTCLSSGDFPSTSLSFSNGFGVTDEGIPNATVAFSAAPSFSEYDGGLAFHSS
jgi:hypothetical protein